MRARRNEVRVNGKAGWIAAILALLFVPAAPTPGHAGQAPSAEMTCNTPPYHDLDFWVGKWNVFDSSDGSKAGHSVLQKVVSGCAIEVDWVGVEGERVKELFYYDRPRQQWVQVWIGDGGASKQRRLLGRLQDGSLRFQGEVAQLNGGSHLDRSTVTPLPNGGIHQVIETSSDGKTWKVSFDAEYRKQR